MKKVWTYLVIAFIALLASVNYELFVFPNQFAPSGINGICTMIQYVTGVSVGYLSLFINIPLAIWCYFEVSKPMAVRSMVYVVTFSLGLLILERWTCLPSPTSRKTAPAKFSAPWSRASFRALCTPSSSRPAPIPAVRISFPPLSISITPTGRFRHELRH